MKRIPEDSEYDSPESVESYNKMVEKYKAIVHGGFIEGVLETISSGKILDVGTGTGQVPIELANRGDFEITGLDVSAEMLEKAGKNAAGHNLKGKINFIQGNVMKFDFQINSFDAVVCFNVLHHFEDPFLLWRRLQSLAKPDGYIFLEDLVRPPKWLIPLYVLIFGGNDGEIRRQYRDSLLSALSWQEWKNFYASTNDSSVFLKKHFLTHVSIRRLGSKKSSGEKNQSVNFGEGFLKKIARKWLYK